MPRKKEYSRYTIAADALGVTHFIVGLLIILVGEFTDLFRNVDLDHGGVQFIFRYLDAPIYSVLGPMIPASSDKWYLIFAASFIVVASSVVYGVIAYIVLRFVASLFGKD